MGAEDTQRLLAPAPIEQEIKLEYVDIPKLHTYNHEVAQEFFEELAGTDNMDLFNTKAVRKMIEFKWPLVLKYTLRRLFVPFVFFLLTFVLYMNSVYPVFIHKIASGETEDDEYTKYYILNIVC